MCSEINNKIKYDFYTFIIRVNYVKIKNNDLEN